jgi:hypothetical protein
MSLEEDGPLDSRTPGAASSARLINTNSRWEKRFALIAECAYMHSIAATATCTTCMPATTQVLVYPYTGRARPTENFSHTLFVASFV